MTKIYAILLMVIFTACSASEEKNSVGQTDELDHSTHAANSQEQAKPKSPLQMTMTNVGNNHIHIEYHSPSKRGRKIFGGLVGFGEVWVTGAHNATSIQFSTDVEIAGVKIPNGKYAIFTIPSENEWTVIINKNWDQHLADEYDENEDLVRLTVIPEKPNVPAESLTYEVNAIDDKTGTISITWDDVVISFEVNNL